MRLEPAKSILQTVSQSDAEAEFFPRAYNMNLYRGCSHGCIYCDARSVCYRLDSPGEVRAKANALSILHDELKRKKRPGIVGLGGMSDGYNPEEAREELTRGALKLLLRYGFGIGITTKSPLAARDIDLLRDMQKMMPVHVTFSITAADDALSLKLEPGVAPSSARFLAMREIAAAGIPVGTWINPVLPFLTDDWENLDALLEMTCKNGGAYAETYLGMTLREGNREYFYAALDRDFPGVKQKYVAAFGNSYIIPSPDDEALYPKYTAACDKLGLPYRFDQICALIMESGGVRQERLW